MKTVCLYFSGTGNNLYVASKIAAGVAAAENSATIKAEKDGISEDTDTRVGDSQLEVLPVSVLGSDAETYLENEAPFDIADFDTVVFCAPSYYSHVPPFVLEMIGKVRFTPEQKIYSVVVCAGNRGLAVEDLRMAITCSGGQIFGEYAIMLPGSYILSYGAFPKWLCGIENSFARNKIKKIVNDIIAGEGHLIKSPGMFYREKDETRLRTAIDGFGKIGKNYTVASSCTGCGTCAKVCPVGNVNMVDGKPVFSDKCQQCMACIQWCPNKAIDYEGKAEGKKRYHHGAVKAKDMWK